MISEKSECKFPFIMRLKPVHSQKKKEKKEEGVSMSLSSCCNIVFKLFLVDTLGTRYWNNWFRLKKEWGGVLAIILNILRGIF